MIVTVRLTLDEEARLDALARRTGCTKSSCVRTAVREYLEDLEDAYAADQALKDFGASGRRSRSLTDLAADLSLSPAELAGGRALNHVDEQ